MVGPLDPGPWSPGKPDQNVALNRWSPSRSQLPVNGGPAGLMSWLMNTPPSAKLMTAVTGVGSASSWWTIIQLPATPFSFFASAGEPSPTLAIATPPAATPARAASVADQSCCPPYTPPA